MKKILLLFVSLCLLIIPTSCSTPEMKLVNKIADAENQELSQLTFFEINILKNAIFSLSGYRYAGDRPWLYEYFYNYKGEEKSSAEWDMSMYSFPHPDTVQEFKIDKKMKRAIANVRVALYNKIRSYKDINAIDRALENEYKNHGGKIFGRSIKTFKDFSESLQREIHGYNRIVSIIDNDSNFDACELLGVYMGSVVLLKNIIEAKNGKTFRSTLGWEISQLVGITPKQEQYDRNKLPDIVKSKLLILDTVIKKMKYSGMGDLPKEFKKDKMSIPVEDAPYDEYEDNSMQYSAAC